MQPAVVIRLRPVGPWRYGPGDGAAGRVDLLYRSDRLYSAVSLAMGQLGFFEEWLEETARALQPAVVFSSLFPYQGDTLLAVPPATVWPPASALISAPSPGSRRRIRWEAARFAPLRAIESLLGGENIVADQWTPDAESGCLLPRERSGSAPFRVVRRRGAAVDRISGNAVSTDAMACVEFEPGSGLWTVARFADSAAASKWNGRIRAAFRLLADSGFGGRRKSGWGQTGAPEFQEGMWPAVLMKKPARASGPALYWMLSLYSPAAVDAVGWNEGDYRVTVRGGWVESTGATGVQKKAVGMISEGSVLAAQSEPVGAAVDVAPEGFPHPVYRCGFAVALRLPTMTPESEPPAGSEEEPAGEV